MATAIGYGQAPKSFLNKEVDWDSDAVKVLLLDDTYAPNRNTHRYLSDITGEIIGTNYTAGGVTEMSRIVARGLENRRHMLMRSLEAHVFKAIMERNEGVLKAYPSLTFTPRRITLNIDQDIVQAMLKLRDRGDISRETSLEELDFDQNIEVRRRAREKMDYDEVFQSQTPYGSPETNPYGAEDPTQPPGAQPKKPVAGSSPEGGRPAGVTETRKRQPKGSVKA